MERSIIDPQNMYKAIQEFPKHLLKGMEIGKSIELKKDYSGAANVVVAGMGGSAIGGDVSRILTSDSMNIPYVVSRHYKLPNWVNKNTIVICSSYSGNTEETLAAYEDAMSKGAMIIGITTGGTLADLLVKNGQDKIDIPGGLQPRAALAFSVVPMLFLLQKLNLIKMDLNQLIIGSAGLLEQRGELYSQESDANPLYAFAKNIYNTIPVIWGENEATAIIASRWKGQLCENSKMIAYHNDLPELNHNEIVGWENNPELLNTVSLIYLTDESDHARVTKRQQITSTVLKDKPFLQEFVKVDGKNKFERFLHMIHYGDWVSYWCAILHKTDPSPVKVINYLKGELAK